MATQFKIKILDRDFVIDDRMEEFREVGKNNPPGPNTIPVGQFRYKDNSWFILWDKAFQTYYNPSLQPVYPSFPLSVEWVEVVFLQNDPADKEQMDLIILLSETLRIIRSKCPSIMKKADKLKKFVELFNRS